MTTYLTSFIISFIFVCIATPILIKIGLKFGFVDQVNQRKIHRGAIPRIGGIGISLGTLLPIFLLFYIHSGIEIRTNNSIFLFFAGGLGISLVGLFDDIRGINAKVKFLFQIAIAVMATLHGALITSLPMPWGRLELGFFGYILTVFWIIGIINAFNLIDGMDGLSSGITLFSSLTIAMLAIVNGYLPTALVALALAGAVTGFLIYNFNPAKIFMGDSGSMFIGYILAILSLRSQSKAHAVVSILVPIIAMGLPILDTTLAFMRRLLRHQSIFSADKQHIHHFLLSLGFNQRKTVLIMYSISILFTILSMLMIFKKSLDTNIDTFLIVIVFAIIVFVIIKKLGYVEMIYGKFRVKKENSLEKHLENFFIDRISLDPNENFFSELPIKGFDILDIKGNNLFSTGEKDKINFFDISARRSRIVRLYWTENVPIIGSRESAMLILMSKTLVAKFAPISDEDEIKLLAEVKE
ncbi:undecaprenyl/decaprenyl-phosphate alpha-N-acetylglucosaminyl 1-phosphate transferase [bacterium]|jgi:UDP-GlcNAc:undecaprenyl-phosphate GlcNAc-1-phosphate transferase|nr:undecaprenyl/decaprenyl-phosphate alpha-N-acetylglucosaminyl 1-phosphate transferase [bacterium]